MALYHTKAYSIFYNIFFILSTRFFLFLQSIKLKQRIFTYNTTLPSFKTAFLVILTQVVHKNVYKIHYLSLFSVRFLN